MTIYWMARRQRLFNPEGSSTSTSPSSGLFQTIASVALPAAVVAPATVILHEFGHLVAGLIMGYPVRLHPTSVSGGPTLDLSPPVDVAIQASAGPLVTAVLMIAAALFLRRSFASPWSYALGVAAPIRFLVGVVFVTGNAWAWLNGRSYAGRPNFDEFNAAAAVGISPLWIATVQAGLLIIFWVWVAKTPPRGRQLMCLRSALAGGAAGMTLWMIISPALLN